MRLIGMTTEAVHHRYIPRGRFQAPQGNGLLTSRGLLIRDSESFGARFRGAEGTLKVLFGPQKFSLETESATRVGESS